MTTNREQELQRGFFMVRAMCQSGQEFDHFFDRNIVAVGWSSTDFTESNNIDQLLRLIEKTYYNDGTDPRVVGRKKSEIRRFMSIRPQDYILVPYYSTVVLARAGSERSYDSSVAESLDLSNQLQVEYRRVGGEIIQVPRAELTEGLQRRLRVRGSTVSDLREFASEILGLFCSERPETWGLAALDPSHPSSSFVAAGIWGGRPTSR